MTRSRFLLCAVHLLGNGSLLLLGYYWLGMGEADGLELVRSALLILALALAAIWLHGTALVMFRREETLSFRTAAVRSLRHLLPLFILSIVVFFVYMALWHFNDSFGHQAFNIGSYSTMKLRRPVAPNNVLKAFHIFIWIMRWIVVPVLAFPLAAAVAYSGWQGFRLAAFRRSKKVLFWIEAGVLLVAATHLPLHLYFWVPKMSSFSMEVVSVTARFSIAYLLFTAGLLAVEFFTSAGIPRTTQVSTVVSP